MVGQFLRRIGVHMQLAKTAAKRLVLLDRHLLIAEEDHEIFHQGVAVRPDRVELLPALRRLDNRARVSCQSHPDEMGAVCHESGLGGRAVSRTCEWRRLRDAHRRTRRTRGRPRSILPGRYALGLQVVS
jgi:hypothetical protein